MFIGHFGAAFGAKAIAPEISLGTLFLAAQFPDLLWSTLLLLGFESVRISSGEAFVTPLIFEHYPISHSLLAVMRRRQFIWCCGEIAGAPLFSACW